VKDEPAEVVSRDEGHVRTLTLNRPERHNAFTPQGYRILTDHLQAAAADDEVRVVVLTGAGRGFCSGVDLGALSAAGADLGEFNSAFHALLHVLTSFPKPLLAAVNGAAVGFGFTLLLHCDVVVVAEKARMRAPFAALGTTPEAGSSLLLPRVVGLQRAAELLFTGRWLSADEAVNWGMAARIVAGELLATEMRELAESIAAHPPEAVWAAKRLLLIARAEEVEAAIRDEGLGAAALGEILGGGPKLQ
jgi:enoyl-CoA hydratase/carnithine racemase